MIRTDGRPTIANAVSRLEDLPVELLSDRERAERAENRIVDQVLGTSCYFCGSTAAEFEGDTELGCPDCGFDAADEHEFVNGYADFTPKPVDVSVDEEPGPMNANQEAFDERLRVEAKADRERMERRQGAELKHLDIDLLDLGRP